MNAPVLFAVVTVISVAAFVASCVWRFRLLTLGKPEDCTSRCGTRLGQMLLYAFGQRRVISRPFGINHFVIFWSFLVLAVANAEFVVQGLFPSVGFSRLPAPLYHALGYVFDVVSLLTLTAIAAALGRRLFFPPQYIEARNCDAFLILGFIAVLLATYFGSHACGIAGDPVGAEGGFRPVSRRMVALFRGLSAEGIEPWGVGFWWIHAIALLAFLNYLPYSKHMHILTAIPNCFLRRLEQPNTLPREKFEKGGTFGVGRLDGFTWKDLLDAYACTECGRCQDVCPATNTAKPLNPRLVIHDLKMNLLTNGAAMLKGRPPRAPLIGAGGEGSVSEDAIWACTSCGACMEVCPVFIEQMPKILLMRRDLVETQARMPAELITFFENAEQRSNPWGIAPGERTKWYANLNVKPFDANTEYLFYVGCAGSFDARSKQVTVALTRILDAAGISWGVLGKDEKCCGDSLRRLGNEYVFDRLARENIALFRERGVRKIITECPHCFSTLKNDYRQFGADLEVIHYTQLIRQLLASGRLRLNPGRDIGRLVIHDSCYLTRHNDVTSEPREVLAAATGHAPLEMKRNRRNSFCCGAGGGRMWMEESLGTRINLSRVKEALDEKPDAICVCCPYCMTMMEDGVKDLHAEERVRVKDLAEIVAERLIAPAGPA